MFIKLVIALTVNKESIIRLNKHLFWLFEGFVNEANTRDESTQIITALENEPSGFRKEKFAWHFLKANLHWREKKII